MYLIFFIFSNNLEVYIILLFLLMNCLQDFPYFINILILFAVLFSNSQFAHSQYLHACGHSHKPQWAG